MSKGVLITLSGIALFWLMKKFGIIKPAVVRMAEAHLKKWDGLFETDSEVVELLHRYWNDGGWDWIDLDEVSTVDNEQPWSSAFISSMFKQSGAGDKFKYSTSHAVYTLQAIENREISGAKLIAHKIGDYKPKVGDLIVRERASYYGGWDGLTSSSKTHGDIVVDITKDSLVVIGGNVGNTVAKSFIPHQNGIPTGSRYFAVIENNI